MTQLPYNFDQIKQMTLFKKFMNEKNGLDRSINSNNTNSNTNSNIIVAKNETTNSYNNQVRQDLIEDTKNNNTRHNQPTGDNVNKSYTAMVEIVPQNNDTQPITKRKRQFGGNSKQHVNRTIIQSNDRTIIQSNDQTITQSNDQTNNVQSNQTTIDNQTQPMNPPLAFRGKSDATNLLKSSNWMTEDTNNVSKWKKPIISTENSPSKMIGSEDGMNSGNDSNIQGKGVRSNLENRILDSKNSDSRNWDSMKNGNEIVNNVSYNNNNNNNNNNEFSQPIKNVVRIVQPQVAFKGWVGPMDGIIVSDQQNYISSNHRQIRKYSNQLNGQTSFSSQTPQNGFNDNSQNHVLTNRSNNTNMANSNNSRNGTNITNIITNSNPSFNPSLNAASASLSTHSLQDQYARLVERHEYLKQVHHQNSLENQKSRHQTLRQVEQLRQKLYDTQSRQDMLAMENQRLKKQLAAEADKKRLLQEEKKELEFRCAEWEERVVGEEVRGRQRLEELQHWKGVTEALKRQKAELQMGLEHQKDQIRILQAENDIYKRERDIKDQLAEQLRRRVLGLVDQNNAAKDQLFGLATKLYQMEQEAQVLKADLMREGSQVVRDRQNSQTMRQNHNQQYRQNISSANLVKQYGDTNTRPIDLTYPQQGKNNKPEIKIYPTKMDYPIQMSQPNQLRTSPPQNQSGFYQQPGRGINGSPKHTYSYSSLNQPNEFSQAVAQSHNGLTQIAPSINSRPPALSSLTPKSMNQSSVVDEAPRRRGEFARERGTLKGQNSSMIVESSGRFGGNNLSFHGNGKDNSSANIQAPRNNIDNNPRLNPEPNRRKSPPLPQMQSQISTMIAELEKLKEAKSLTGAMRRRKIQIQRELEKHNVTL